MLVLVGSQNGRKTLVNVLGVKDPDEARRLAAERVVGPDSDWPLWTQTLPIDHTIRR